MISGTRLGRRSLYATGLALAIIGVAVWWTTSRHVVNGTPDRATGGEAVTHSGGRDVGSPAVQSKPGDFPTNGGEPRELLLESAATLRRFASSRMGYFTTLRRGDLSSTAKREFAYDNAEVSVVDRWKRDLVAVSDDGSWVVAQDGAHVYVLDASTGETVFQRMWLSRSDHRVDIREGRLVPDSRIADPEDIARCQGKREVVFNPEDQSDEASTIRFLVDSTDEKACFADLRERGLYRTVYDVYDLRTLVDGAPLRHYRVEYGENPHCGSGDDPLGTLEVRNDRLVYVPRT